MCISFAAGQNGCVSTPFPLPGICGFFAKQMSLLPDRARTHGSGPAAFAHLGLKLCYRAESLERTKSASTTKKAVSHSLHKVLHLKLPQTQGLHAPQHSTSLTHPLYNPVKLSPATVQTLYSQRRGSVQDLSQLLSTSV